MTPEQRELLRQKVRDVLSLQDAHVTWDGAPRAVPVHANVDASRAALVELAIVSSAPVGVYADARQTITGISRSVMQHVERDLVIQADVRSFSQAHDAIDLALDLALGIEGEGPSGELEAANVSISEANPVRALALVVDGAQYSRAIVEWRAHVAFERADTTAEKATIGSGSARAVPL